MGDHGDLIRERRGLPGLVLTGSCTGTGVGRSGRGRDGSHLGIGENGCRIRPRCPRRKGHPDAGQHHQCGRSHLQHAEPLAEQHHPGHQSDRRFQAQQDAEHVAGQAAQGRQLQGVRKHRGQHGRTRCEGQQAQVHQPGHGTGGTQRQHRQGTDRHGHRQAVLPGHQLSHPGAAEHVQAPEHRSHQRQQHPDQVQVIRAGEGLQAEQAHSTQGQQHPQQVAAPGGEHGGHGERAQELDRHGGAERDPLDRGVEGSVHRPDHHTEHGDGHPLAAGEAVQLGPGDRQQHHCGDTQAQRRGAPRTDRREQLYRQGRTELQAHARGQDHQHRHGTGAVRRDAGGTRWAAAYGRSTSGTVDGCGSGGERGGHEPTVHPRHTTVQRIFATCIVKQN